MKTRNFIEIVLDMAQRPEMAIGKGWKLELDKYRKELTISDQTGEELELDGKEVVLDYHPL